MISSIVKHSKAFYRYFKIDIPLFILIIILVAFGLLILYSSSGESIDLVYRQLTRLAIAIGVMIVVSQIPPLYLNRAAPTLITIGIFLLILVLLFGSSGGGAQRWLNLGFIKFQPSEMMKIIIPISIASILSERTLPPAAITSLKSITVIIIVVSLIALQPDLGTSLLIGASGIYVLFFSGVNIRLVKSTWLNLGLILAILSGSLYVAWNYLLMPYQQKRIITLFNPESDPLGSGYHIMQSKIAIGSGGLTGKGLNQGSQSQLNFVPESSTDFIFSVLAEETGFIGVLFLLFIYLLIIYRCMDLSMRCEDNFSRLLGASLTFIFFTYVFVNIAMVSGLLPVVGVPLPLISYGGSSLLTLMTSLGIIMSIYKNKTPRYIK
jgi:rod shape determining protein RodA